MTVPLIILAVFTIGLGFHRHTGVALVSKFLGSTHDEADSRVRVIRLMMISSVVVFIGGGVGLVALWLPANGRRRMNPMSWRSYCRWGCTPGSRRKYCIDELYEMTVIRFNAWFARPVRSWTMGVGWRGKLVSYLTSGWVSWVNVRGRVRRQPRL